MRFDKSSLGNETSSYKAAQLRAELCRNSAGPCQRAKLWLRSVSAR